MTQNAPALPAEAFSFWTHALSAAATVPVLFGMLATAEGATAQAGVAIYGSTLILLFASSAFHHKVGALGPTWHQVSRRLDHIAIFLLIAGTYTPVALLVLPPPWSAGILATVWSLAAAGIVLKTVTPHSPRWITVGLYLAMGWIAIFAIWPLSRNLSGAGLAWLVGGGAIYSVGAIGYATRRPDLWPERVGFHGVWHVFVMAGAACHVVMTWRHVL